MHIYLIHGSDEVQVQNERMRIVDQLLPEDQRDENLTEFSASSHRALTLSALLPDLLAELGTISFFPGARRVAIVHNLSDFWTSAKDAEPKPAAIKGKKKPADASERLIRYFEDDFDSTGNAVIFTVNEDPDKRLAVDTRKKLVAWIKEHGKIRTWESRRPAAWVLGDAILQKNLSEALAQFRLAYRKGQSDQALAVHGTILRQVRFLLQAKIASAVSGRQNESYIMSELFPKDPKGNLMKLHPFPRKNYTEAARYFSITQLTQSLSDLYTIYTYILPQQTDVYVADVGLLMERVLIRLCARTA